MQTHRKKAQSVVRCMTRLDAKLALSSAASGSVKIKRNSKRQQRRESEKDGRISLGES